MGYTKFDDLWEVVESFGINKKEKVNIIQIFTEGNEIDLKDFHQNIIKTNEGLYFIDEKGRVLRVVLYISQRRKDIIEREKGGFPKYHVSWCRTLEHEITEKKGKEKYKMVSRFDGKFFFMITHRNKIHQTIPDQALVPCINCMNLIKSNINDFNLKIFTENFTDQLKIKRNDFQVDMDTIPDIYPDNWKKIAQAYKLRKNYTCEICSLIFKDKNKRFLHAHHINNVKNDVKETNIEILCIECHANQDNHSHIKSTPEYKIFIKKYKQEILNETTSI